MKIKRDKLAQPTKEYIEKAKALPKGEAERLMSRAKGKFARRFEDKTISAIETIALQMAHEDDQLKDWRKNIAELREKRKK